MPTSITAPSAAISTDAMSIGRSSIPVVWVIINSDSAESRL